MMILPIYLYGQPVLRKIAEDIEPDYANLKQLINNMFDTMYNAEGVGLAAPQVGLSIRLFVMDLSVLEDLPPDVEKRKRVFINAHIVERDGEETIKEEGCLSLPGIHENVSRKERIRIQYMDENLVAHDEIIEGYLARVIQHEYDHIDGVMFVDHIAGIRKQLIKSKLNALMKGKANCAYPVKAVRK